MSAALEEHRANAAWAFRVLGKLPSADEVRGAMQRAAFRQLRRTVEELIARVEELEGSNVDAAKEKPADPPA